MQASNWSITLGSEEEVVCMTMSADCSKHAFGIAGDFHSPGPVGRANDFSEILADLRGVGINGAHNVHGFFFSEQFNNRGANGPDPILNGTNFLLHGCLRSMFGREQYSAEFRWERTIKRTGIR